MALTNVDLYRIDGTIGSVSNISTASLNGGPLAGTRNRIINGDMRIDQRNAGAAVTIDNNFVYTLDRWQPEDATDGVFTCQRSTVAPTGFTNSLLLTVTTADTSLAASQFAYVRQCIEGFNIVDFGWGTASAQAVTLSFWVRSSITGTFGGSIKNSASNRSYPFTYAITSANTWEYKTIIIPGDTSGTWLADNGLGLQLMISIGAGSTLSGAAGAWAGANYVSATGATPLIGTNGATFYITGVQLEAGTVATPFERRSYGQELALCQRYYYKIAPGSAGRLLASGGNTSSTSIFNASLAFPVTMRIRPTAVEQTGTAGDYLVYHSGSSSTCTSAPAYNPVTSSDFACVDFTSTAAFTVGRSGLAGSSSTAAYLAWSAEL